MESCRRCNQALVVKKCSLSHNLDVETEITLENECRNAKDHFCITFHDRGFIELVCYNCHLIYIGCSTCSSALLNDRLEIEGTIQLCKFLGHSGFFWHNRIIQPNCTLVEFMRGEKQNTYGNDWEDLFDDIQAGEMIEFKEHDTKVLEKYPEETLKCNFLIPFYVGHLDNFYINLENLDPTGPSG